MGRPRIYESDAARQAEHRARRRQQSETSTAAHRSLLDRVARLHAALAANPQLQHLAGASPVETLEALIVYLQHSR